MHHLPIDPNGPTRPNLNSRRQQRTKGGQTISPRATASACLSPHDSTWPGIQASSTPTPCRITQKTAKISKIEAINEVNSSIKRLSQINHRKQRPKLEKGSKLQLWISRLGKSCLTAKLYHPDIRNVNQCKPRYSSEFEDICSPGPNV